MHYFERNYICCNNIARFETSVGALSWSHQWCLDADQHRIDGGLLQAFYRSELYPLLSRINSYLMRWIRNKYKRLRAVADDRYGLDGGHTSRGDRASTAPRRAVLHGVDSTASMQPPLPGGGARPAGPGVG